MKESRTLLKVALLSTCLVWAAINAITANIPEMAKSFPDVDLYVVELVATVPSLFQMLAVLLSSLGARTIGPRRTTIVGLVLCGVAGVLPVFVPGFVPLFASRCVFGVGCGLIVPSVLSLIIGLFDGEERSSMIGLQGSVGGLGSAVSAFVAGRLLAFGWRWSFVVYVIAFVALALFASGVPKSEAVAQSDNGEANGTDGQKGSIPYLMLQAAAMLASILFLTLFVVKASTYIVEAGLGTARQGSLAITLVSLVAGAAYGRIRSKLGDYALVAFHAIGAAGFVVAALGGTLATVMVAAFLVGYSMMALVPHLQENVSLRCADLGTLGTNVILVAQALGAFAAPYLGTLLGAFLPALTDQFLVCAAAFVVLAGISWAMARG